MMAVISDRKQSKWNMRLVCEINAIMESLVKIPNLSDKQQYVAGVDWFTKQADMKISAWHVVFILLYLVAESPLLCMRPTFSWPVRSNVICEQLILFKQQHSM